MKLAKVILYIVVVYSIYSIAIALINKSHNSGNAEYNENNHQTESRECCCFTRLPIQSVKIIDEYDSITSLNDMSKNGELILFSYNEKDCKSCVYSYLQVLDKTFNSEQVVVLCEVNTSRILKFEQKELDVSFPFYKKDYKYLFDSLKSPFIAVLSKENTLEYIYSPSLEKYDEYIEVLDLYRSFFD